MPELRHDPLQKRWGIIATDRARRPSDFADRDMETETGTCPFCAGNEGKTPPEIAAVREDGSPANGPGWSVRVVPNKYPALGIEGELDRRGLGIFDAMNGVGAHEIIIESPDHDTPLSELPDDHVEQVLTTWPERIRDLRKDERFRYVLIFKNHGKKAGASLAHPHTQLIATPVTPLNVARELESCRVHFHAKERCLFCDIIAQELSIGDRIVHVDGNFAVMTPFASRFPFETLIIPLRHQYDFSLISPEDISSLARTLKTTLRKLNISLNDPPYNFILHNAPNTGSIYPHRPGILGNTTV